MADETIRRDRTALKEDLSNLKTALREAKIQRSTILTEKDRLSKEVDNLKSKKACTSKKLIFYKKRAMSNVKEKEMLVWKIEELKMKMGNFALMKEALHESTTFKFEASKDLPTATLSNNTKMQELLNRKNVLSENLEEILQDLKKIKSVADDFSKNIDCA